MPRDLSAFRLGDIRGIYPDDIDETFVEGFAHALVGRFNLSGRIATGRDMRDSSEALQSALNDTLSRIGIEVVNIGLCPTELGYFASAMPNIEAAIVVTASHNPARHNGLKCVLSNGQPITRQSGLSDIRALMAGDYRHRAARGAIVREDFHARYLDFLKQHFPPETLRHGQVALNGLNGTAATMADMIATEFELPVTWFRKTPGPMPEQGADPANPRVVREMKSFMAGEGFSLGVAWDGDCDRCVCFDNDGDLVPTYYLIGLLIEKFLGEQPGGVIVFDTRLCWNTLDTITRLGGVGIPAETGHAFMKDKMRSHRAVYGGELSSHHYFGDFFGCDSGMFAWLTVLGLLARSEPSMREMIEVRRREISTTPEINLALTDVDRAFASVLAHFGAQAMAIDHFDGLSFTMPDNWRFSLRRSKTEPVVRLNFEARRARDTLLAEGPRVFEVLAPFRGDDRDWMKNFYIQ